VNLQHELKRLRTDLGATPLGRLFAAAAAVEEALGAFAWVFADPAASRDDRLDTLGALVDAYDDVKALRTAADDATRARFEAWDAARPAASLLEAHARHYARDGDVAGARARLAATGFYDPDVDAGAEAFGRAVDVLCPPDDEDLAMRETR
jgi:hypothetical protein